MILLPFMISGLMGGLLLLRILKEPIKMSSFLFLGLALSIGLGCSSLLTFYSFVIFNTFNPKGILLLHFLLIVFLCIKLNIVIKPSTIPIAHLGQTLVFWTIWIVFFFVIWTISKHHPFGEWDAWAVWNLKTKFLVADGTSWQDIFRLHWHTQPDYPWFLPCLNAWVYSVTQKDLALVAQSTSVVFAVSMGILLFAGLQRYLNPYVALLASGLLITNRSYIFLATAQYADIVLAYYLLAAYIVFTLIMQKENKNFVCVYGLSLGFLPFIKNEGIIISLLLLMIFLLTIVLENGRALSFKKEMALKLLGFYCLSAFATFLFKIFLAPPNRDITFTQLSSLPTLFSLERCQLIIQSVIAELFNPQWEFLWIFLLFMLIVGWKKYFLNENKFLLLFFGLYALVVFVIYLLTMNFDLSWRLSRTVPRILFYLLPSILFFSFYVHGRRIS